MRPFSQHPFGRPPAARSFRAFAGEKSGTTTVITALAIPMFIALAGLGTEAGFAYMRHSATKSVAEMAALSAATAIASGVSNVANDAKAVTAAMGFPAGTDGIQVVVNSPPTSGSLAGNIRAVEVTVGQDRQPYFMSYFRKATYRISGRAVAMTGIKGNGCVLTLDPTAGYALQGWGSAYVDMSGCDSYVNSNNAYAGAVGGSSVFKVRTIYTVGTSAGFTGEIVNGTRPLPDPYANVPLPSYSICSYNNKSVNGAWAPTVTAGVPTVFCGGLDLKSNADVTLPAGVYIIAGGDFTVNGGARLRGTGVTLIFTSRAGSWPGIRINGGADVRLVAPTSGPYSGLVMYYDRTAPDWVTVKLNGGGSQVLGGAIYMASLPIEYTGSSTVGSPTNAADGCTQIIAKRISFSGNSTVGSSCDGYGTRAFGAVSTSLME